MEIKWRTCREGDTGRSPAGIMSGAKEMNYEA